MRTSQPATAAPDLRWMDAAACAGMDVDQFYPPERDWLPPDAARVCASCPVRVDCLEHALTVEGDLGPPERHGIWGGQTPAARWRLTTGRALQ